MDIKAAKELIDCRDEIEKILGMPLSRGRTWTFNCPFHDEKTPGAFQVYENGFKCFSCGEYGDIFDFKSKYYRVPLKDVLGEYKVDPEQEIKRKAEAAERAEKRLQSEIETAQRVLDELRAARAWLRYHEQLDEYSRQIWRNRGVPDWYQDDMSFGYDPNHTIFVGENKYQSPTLTIPFWENGSVINIKHRILDPNVGIRYYPERSGLGQPLFIANKDKPLSGKVVVIEGEIKAAVAFVTLDDPDMQIVGLTGKEPKKEILAKLSGCDPIYLILDPDAYEKPSPDRPSAANQIGSFLGWERIRSARLRGKIDDMIIEYGLDKEWMQSVLNQAVKV